MSEVLALLCLKAIFAGLGFGWSIPIVRGASSRLVGARRVAVVAVNWLPALVLVWLAIDANRRDLVIGEPMVLFLVFFFLVSAVVGWLGSSLYFRKGLDSRDRNGA